MSHILACIDGGPQTTGVCDYAIWVARHLGAPLRFLQVLDRQPEQAPVHDLSGNVGLDAQETLLAELTQLDEARNHIAQRHGRELLEAAQRRAEAAQARSVEILQRQGNLVEILLDLQVDTRVIVIGQHPVPGSVPRLRLDLSVERVVRGLQKPILVATNTFRQPARAVIAFDGSATGRKLIESLSRSPLLHDLQAVLVSAGPDPDTLARQQQWAMERLAEVGFTVEARHQIGSAESVIQNQIERQQADLLIMGAYGHSRIREFIVGSTTTTLLRTSPVPVMILR